MWPLVLYNTLGETAEFRRPKKEVVVDTTISREAFLC